MRLALAAAAICLLVPSAAAASTAKVVESHDYYSGEDYAAAYYTAVPGEANDVTLAGDAHSIAITDPGADIEAGDGCAASGPHAVTCTSEYDLTPVQLALGDESDRFTSDGPSFYADGEEGDDVLHGGDAGGVFKGGKGDDVLDGSKGGGSFYGGEGDDEMTGGPGRDFFMGGPGADTIDGGGDPARYTLGDTVDYRDHARPVTVDLSKPGSPAGEAGEGDSLSNVENVDGTEGPDRVTAPATVPNPGTGSLIRGFGGNDVITGGPGADDLEGGAGADRIAGGDGNDAIRGDTGRDVLRGDGGSNYLVSEDSGPAERDRVDCGAGGTALPGSADMPLLDLIDQSCGRIEFLYNWPVHALTHAYTGDPTRAVSTSMVARRRCRVRIALHAHGELLGAAHDELRRGQRGTLTVVLPAAAREELRRSGALKLRVSLAFDWGQRLGQEQATSYRLLLHDPPAASRAMRSR